MGPNQTSCFCTAKETIKKKMKRQPMEWEKTIQMMQLTRVNLQNIQTSHTTHQQKTQHPN